jgi:chromosome condensin MukBEF MukE localization factor
MDTSSIVGWSGLVLSILGIIYSAVNHKHCKVLICGRRIEFGIDVDSTETYLKEEEEKKKEEEEKKKKDDEEKKKEEEENKKKKEKEEEENNKNKQKEEEEKKKISYTPHVFKIQPLHF